MENFIIENVFVILLILKILLVYIIQVWICTIINLFYETRNPKNFIDFLKLTFFPYLFLAIKNGKNN